jgi:FAD/FMN-containing dehydrogenase
MINDLIQILGVDGVRSQSDAMQPFLQEWRGRIEGKSQAVLLPQSTEQVSKIVQYCVANKIALVPQGGNTGLVGASIPVEQNPALCLSLKRMNKIKTIDANDFSMTAEAGCILQNLQNQVASKDLFIGMTLASEGSATVGGLIATNAGGSMTIRYGNMREQILGLEVVMPDGKIWNNLKSLRKNNSGYDLKHLFIGSEGTLGIITAATIKLHPKPTLIETAMIGLASPEKAIEALGLLRASSQDKLAAFELMPRLALDTAEQNNLSGIK